MMSSSAITLLFAVIVAADQDWSTEHFYFNELLNKTCSPDRWMDVLLRIMKVSSAVTGEFY